jgi:XTP/dITP diphosphohydrolase
MDADLVICTGNPGKLIELRALLPKGIRAITLEAAGLPLDLPETGATLHANAEQKARFAFERCGIPCVADDSGLEVEALGGAPGVFSARYAGEEKSAAANMRKLLHELQGVIDRRARFRTVIAYVDIEGVRSFEGEVCGVITDAPRGDGGFGYDPVFLPEMSDLTFAELDPMRKNAISHRAQAMWKFARFIGEHHRAG